MLNDMNDLRFLTCVRNDNYSDCDTVSKAGIQKNNKLWIPAFAGMTELAGTTELA